MTVQKIEDGVVVTYQDDLNTEEVASVTVTTDGKGEWVRVELHRVGQEDRTIDLTYHDSLALAAALTAAEVPPPPKGRRTRARSPGRRGEGQVPGDHVE